MILILEVLMASTTMAHIQRLSEIEIDIVNVIAPIYSYIYSYIYTYKYLWL